MLVSEVRLIHDAVDHALAIGVRLQPASATALLQPRWAMTFMRGPMTRVEIKRARAGKG